MLKTQQNDRKHFQINVTVLFENTLSELCFWNQTLE